MNNVNAYPWRKPIVLTGAGIMVLLALWQLAPDRYASMVMALDVSSDGRYAISSHRDNRLVLWDIEQQRQRRLTQHGNIYIAQFTQQDDAIVWQDLDNVVRVMSMQGEALYHFEHPPAYSLAAMSAEGPFVMSGYASDIAVYHNEQRCSIKGDSVTTVGAMGKPLNLTLNQHNGWVLSSGYGGYYQDGLVIEEHQRNNYARLVGVTLWDTDTCQPLYNFPGNSAKTHATLSPDGRYAISVDENRLSYIWDTKTGERAYIIADSFQFGQFIGGFDVSDSANWNNDGAHIFDPDDFPKDFHGGPMVAIQFISNTQYLTFYYSQPYVALWELGDPFAHAILPIGTDPFPSVNAYARNASIATAPAAHRLVTGQRDGGGINVYDFDPDTQTLTPVWTPRLNPFWWPF